MMEDDIFFCFVGWKIFLGDKRHFFWMEDDIVRKSENPEFSCCDN